MTSNGASGSAGLDLRALWFGDVPMIGHLHTPKSATPLDLCAVICPAPFGYDNVCGHRGLRILGDRLALDGIAALRFDFPGCGDSDGEQDLTGWIAAVGAAVAAARRESGCKQIAILGVGFGGTLALAALDRGDFAVDKLLLWGVPARGKAWLREQRTFQKVAALATTSKDPNVPPAPPSPPGIEELSGFPMATKFAEELIAFDVNKVDAARWPADRSRPPTMIVTRIPEGDEKTLQAAMDARGITPTIESRDGFNQMFDQPHLSIAPRPLFAFMSEWLAKDVATRAAYPSAPDIRALPPEGASTRVGPGGLVEEIARYQHGEAGRLFSIETRPANREPSSTWVIFLTGRAVRHIGPNRIWVKLAREFAAKGIPSLRLDGRSVGDSDGEGNGLMPNAEYYQEHIYDDIENVMRIATAEGAKSFLLTGICSGATGSYQIAWRRQDVRAIVLLNMLQLRHDPEDDDAAVVQQAAKFGFRKELWLNPESYKRLLRGELSPQMRKVLLSRAVLLAPLKKLGALAKRGLKAVRKEEPSYIVKGMNDLAHKPVEIDIYLSQGDLSVNFLERHFGTDLAKLDPKIRVHRVWHTDHTNRPLFAQERFFEILRAALARITDGQSAAAEDPPRASASAE